MSGLTTVVCTCSLCGKTNTLSVERGAYEAWKAGRLVQDAFPGLSASDRELLISGMCDPCFSSLWDEE